MAERRAWCGAPAAGRVISGFSADRARPHVRTPRRLISQNPPAVKFNLCALRRRAAWQRGVRDRNQSDYARLNRLVARFLIRISKNAQKARSERERTSHANLARRFGTDREKQGSDWPFQRCGFGPVKGSVRGRAGIEGPGVDRCFRGRTRIYWSRSNCGSGAKFAGGIRLPDLS
jgi:hypothetical protein